MEEPNPYAPPQARVEDQPPPAGAAITIFPRFSAWWVLLLSIATLSLYMPYWMYSRSQLMNRVVPGAVPMLLMYFAVGLFALNIVMGVVEGIYADDFRIKIVSSLAGIVSTIVFVVWVFWLRTRINTLLGARRGDRQRLGVLLTFFLQIIYLQYKINQAIDALHDRPRAPAAA